MIRSHQSLHKCPFILITFNQFCASRPSSYPEPISSVAQNRSSYCSFQKYPCKIFRTSLFSIFIDTFNAGIKIMHNKGDFNFVLNNLIKKKKKYK